MYIGIYCRMFSIENVFVFIIFIYRYTQKPFNALWILMMIVWNTFQISEMLLYYLKHKTTVECWYMHYKMFSVKIVCITFILFVYNIYKKTWLHYGLSCLKCIVWNLCALKSAISSFIHKILLVTFNVLLLNHSKVFRYIY